MGLSVRRSRRAEESRRAADHSGLVHPLRHCEGGGRCRSRERRRLRQAVQRGHRPAAAASAWYPAGENSRSLAHQQHGRGRTYRRACRNRVRGARTRLHQEPVRPGADRRQERPRRAGPPQGRGTDRADAGRTSRHHRDERGRRGRFRHCASAVWRKRAVRDPQRQGSAHRDRAEPSPGREHRIGLRPFGPDLPCDRYPQAHADRGERHRRPRLRRVPAPCPQRARRHHHAAARGADRLSLHALARLELEHHEPRRHRHCHRRDGRCRDRHDRECAQAPGTRPARKAKIGGADRGGDRGRTCAVLQPVDHHGLVPADLRARSAGRPPVQAARLYQDIRHGSGGAVVRDARPGAHDPVRARPDHARAQEPREPPSDLALSAGDPCGASVQGRHDPGRPGDTGGQSLARNEARHRVHAQSQRGHAVLHADHAAGPVGHEGGRVGADAGQDHQVVPRGRHRSGARRDAHRPRPIPLRPRCSRP